MVKDRTSKYDVKDGRYDQYNKDGVQKLSNHSKWRESVLENYEKRKIDYRNEINELFGADMFGEYEDD